MPERVGLIVGTGAEVFERPSDAQRFDVETPYGAPSSAVTQWEAGSGEWLCIARHGDSGNVPPHRVNYRANVWALHRAGCRSLIGINAVGGICDDAPPGRLMLIDQLIDYTWGREHTYSDGSGDSVLHAEFTEPICRNWHSNLQRAANQAGLSVVVGGTCGVTQGPRLETAAEINRLERDGCDAVGMTALPEAALARELGMRYAMCAVVVNWAAGRGAPGTAIHDEIAAHLARGMGQVAQLLSALADA